RRGQDQVVLQRAHRRAAGRNGRPFGRLDCRAGASRFGTTVNRGCRGEDGKMNIDSLYALKTKSLDGKDVDLSDYRGKVTLVVNVASQCGNTPQYAGLEKLHRELSDRGFSVLGFPSNDFGSQEPGSPQQIAQFCETQYGVTF